MIEAGTMGFGTKRNAKTIGTVVAALDIGTHKICCLIGTHEPVYEGRNTTSLRLRTLGFGLQRSQGIEGGAVVDLGLAQSAVVAAVAQAEHAAGVRVDAANIAISCGRLQSSTFNGHVDLPAGLVGEADIARLDTGARAFAARNGRSVLTLNRIVYGLDGTSAVREPTGLAGRRLHANHHAVTVDAGPLRNVGLLVESCHLSIASQMPSGFASALAATTADERHLGVAVVDIGAASTSIACFADGHFVHCDSAPFGGQHITRDLALSLAIPLAEAERIKTLYGSVVQSTSDEHELVPLAQSDAVGNSGSTVSRGHVSRVITRRMEFILANVNSRLAAFGVERLHQCSVVLTGGASLTMGLEGMAGALLARPVRVSAPPQMGGSAGRLTGSVSSPAFSCVVGLALAAGMPSPWIADPARREPSRKGYLGKVERWLRESF